MFYRGVAYLGLTKLICTKGVHLGLSEVVFIEGCPQVRGGDYEGLQLYTQITKVHLTACK